MPKRKGLKGVAYQFRAWWEKNLDKPTEEMFKLFFNKIKIPKPFSREKKGTRVRIFRNELFRHMMAFKVVFKSKRFTELKGSELCKVTDRPTCICKKSVCCPGLGVFANMPIKKNEVIPFLTGNRLLISKATKSALESAEKEPLSSCLAADIGQGMFKEKGTKVPTNMLVYGPGSFLNHACGDFVNCVFDDDWSKVTATEDIDEGCELFIDYGDDYFSEKDPCKNSICCHNAQI